MLNNAGSFFLVRTTCVKPSVVGVVLQYYRISDLWANTARTPGPPPLCTPLRAPADAAAPALAESVLLVVRTDRVHVFPPFLLPLALPALALPIAACAARLPCTLATVPSHRNAK